MIAILQEAMSSIEFSPDKQRIIEKRLQLESQKLNERLEKDQNKFAFISERFDNLRGILKSRLKNKEPYDKNPSQSYQKTILNDEEKVVEPLLQNFDSVFPHFGVPFFERKKETQDSEINQENYNQESEQEKGYYSPLTDPITISLKENIQKNQKDWGQLSNNKRTPAKSAKKLETPEKNYISSEPFFPSPFSRPRISPSKTPISPIYKIFGELVSPQKRALFSQKIEDLGKISFPMEKALMEERTDLEGLYCQPVRYGGLVVQKKITENLEKWQMSSPQKVYHQYGQFNYEILEPETTSTLGKSSPTLKQVLNKISLEQTEQTSKSVRIEPSLEPQLLTSVQNPFSQNPSHYSQLIDLIETDSSPSKTAFSISQQPDLNREVPSHGFKFVRDASEIEPNLKEGSGIGGEQSLLKGLSEPGFQNNSYLTDGFDPSKISGKNYQKVLESEDQAFLKMALVDPRRKLPEFADFSPENENLDNGEDKPLDLEFGPVDGELFPEDMQTSIGGKDSSQRGYSQFDPPKIGGADRKRKTAIPGLSQMDYESEDQTFPNRGSFSEPSNALPDPLSKEGYEAFQNQAPPKISDPSTAPRRPRPPGESSSFVSTQAPRPPSYVMEEEDIESEAYPDEASLDEEAERARLPKVEDSELAQNPQIQELEKILEALDQAGGDPQVQQLEKTKIMIEIECLKKELEITKMERAVYDAAEKEGVKEMGDSKKPEPEQAKKKAVLKKSNSKYVPRTVDHP